jgi:uncharacterized protein
MKLSNAEMQEIDTILEKYCNTKEALSMKNFCQHGSVSTYKHVMYVTRVCYYLNKHFGLGADVKSLVVFMTSIFTTGTKKMTAISGMDSPTRTQPC